MKFFKNLSSRFSISPSRPNLPAHRTDFSVGSTRPQRNRNEITLSATQLAARRAELPKFRPEIPLPLKNTVAKPGEILPSLVPQICPSPLKINVNPVALMKPLSQMVFSPNTAWLTIRNEPLTATQIFEKYVFILSAIGPICGAIGYVQSDRLTFEEGLYLGFSAYGLILLFFFGATYLCHLLSPVFGGNLSMDYSAKLVVYSFMPFFVFLAFFLFPPISFLSLIGAYGIVLFYRGIPILSAVPYYNQLIYFTINSVVWIFFVEMIRCAVFR